MIALDRELPNHDFDAAWDAIKVSPALKDRLLGQAIFALTVRGKVPFASVPLHGVLLLAGPPGTGKTTLAKGLASRIARALAGTKTRFLQIDPHALASASLGKSQQQVTKLFQQIIPEASANGACIVLLDEVETLAASRQKLSLEANPIDVHRATDAALAGLDLLTTEHPNTLILATTNFPAAVDAAFHSRADLVVELPLPDAEARSEIILDTLKAFGQQWPPQSPLHRHVDKFVAASEGLDGRQLRKAIAAAAASTIETARNPGLLTMKQVTDALSGTPRSHGVER